MFRKLKVTMFVCLMVAVAPWAVHADDKTPEDQVSFQVEAGREVDNDRVIAVLVATAEDKRSSSLAESINQSMRWAMDKAKTFPEVKTGSGSYQTYPVHDNNKIVRWRGRQQLQLEATDVDRLSALVGELQSRLQVQSMQFSVSPKRRQQLEDGLIEQAMAAYQARASLVTGALGAKGYDLISLSIHTSGRAPVVPMRAEAMAMNSAAAAPPAIERGTSRLTVQVSATIQLRQN